MHAIEQNRCPCRVDGVRAVPDSHAATITRTHTYPARHRAETQSETRAATQDMSEAQFWVKYFQSRYFWRDKGRAVLEKGSQKADVADDLFARHEEPGDDALQVPPEVRKAVDLSRTDADRFIMSQGEDVVDPAAPAASRVLRKFNRHAALVLGADPPSIPSEEEMVKSDHVALDLKHHDSKKQSKKRSVAAAFALDDEDLDRPVGVQWSEIDVEKALTNKAGIDALVSLDRNVASVQPAPPKQTSQQIEKVAGDVRLLVRALRFTQGTAKRQAILKKLRQLQAFIDQRCAAFNAKPKHAHLSAFFKPVQDQIARALRK